MVVEVQALKSADLSDVLELEQSVQTDPWSERQVLELASLLDSGEYTGAVLRVARCAVAYVIARSLLDECEILSVGVAKKQQGRGYGKQVMHYFLSQLNKDVQRVHLEVRVSNKRAIALYLQLGFVDVGLRKNYYPSGALHSQREDACLMCKNILD